MALSASNWTELLPAPHRTIHPTFLCELRFLCLYNTFFSTAFAVTLTALAVASPVLDVWFVTIAISKVVLTGGSDSVLLRLGLSMGLSFQL